LIFEDLFNGLIWKRLLNHYWQGLVVDKNRSRFSKDFEKLNQITEIEDCFGWFGEMDRALRFDK
jgi:uncharacterized protein YjaG (DUF416 family)